MEVKLSIDLGQIVISLIGSLSLLVILLFRSDIHDLKKRLIRLENLFLKKAFKNED